MGKFSEILEKAEASKGKTLTGLAGDTCAERPDNKIDVHSPDRNPPQTVHSPSGPSTGKIDPRLVTLLEPSTSAAECFKILRSKLLYCGNGKTCRTIMVSSAQPHDGKTLVAANLAVSIARGLDEHVLLVDCDFRRSMLHQTFGLEIHRGLREYLENGNSVAPYLQPTPVEKLTLLPAGERPANPSELLSSEKMRKLIDELKARYQDRYVIIDTPPVQFTAEGNSLASMVDGVLLVVRSGKTSKELVFQAAENIGRDRILGVVFNGGNGSRKYSRRYYGFGSS